MLKDCCVISRLRLFFRFSGAYLVAVLPLIFCFVHVASLRAQERVRTAAGRLEIESFRRPEAFFRIGPLQEELIGGVGIQYTDNSQLTNTNKISRLRFYEGLSLNTTWILSHLNQLQFNFAGQLNEDFYGNGRTRINVGITPDSLVQFQFAVSDFRVRLFDRFSYVQDPTSNPTATNTAYLNNLTNTIGTVIDTDLNLAILTLAADYTYNNQNGSNAQGQTNPTTSGTRNTFRIGPDLTFRWSPQIFYGINTVWSRTTGTSTQGSGGSSNVNSFSAGPFVRGKLSRWTDFDLSGGVNVFETTPSVPLGYYFSGVIRHLLNKNWQVIFQAAHDTVFTTGTNLTEETVFRLGTQLNLTRFIILTGTPFAGFGDEKTGSTQGNFTQYGGQLDLSWKPTRRWTTTLSYGLTRRSGVSASDSYLQNLLTFQVSYRF